MNIFEPEATNTPLELQAENALAALKRYKQEKFDRHIQAETLEELLYDLFEHIWFADKVYHYQQNVVTLLSLLVKPDVASVMRNELSPMVQEDIARMLYNLHDFFRNMGEEYNQLQLAIVEIHYCQDLEKLKHLEAKYQAKLEGCLAEQQVLQSSRLNGHNLKIADHE